MTYRPRWLRQRQRRSPVLVNVTPADPDAVVAALRRYIRRNGSIGGC